MSNLRHLDRFKSQQDESEPTSMPKQQPAPEPHSNELVRQCLTEGVGTFVLVYAGTGAVVTNSISDGAFGHLGISFVFGAVVAALIYTTGHISGTHINPAVTIGLWSGGLFPGRKLGPYIASQCFGAVAASALLYASFGNIENLGATLPRDGLWLEALIIEVVLTFILMLVVLGSAVDKRAPAGFAGAAVGLTVGLEATFMGPITGASMNPARSLGPAFMSGALDYHWVYWVAPIVGAVLATFFYRFVADGFHNED